MKPILARRQFLRAAAGVAVAGLAGGRPAPVRELFRKVELDRLLTAGA